MCRTELLSKNEVWCVGLLLSRNEVWFVGLSYCLGMRCGVQH